MKREVLLVGWDAAARRTDSLGGKAALEQFITLGYVEEPGADEAKAMARTMRELDYNLARGFAAMRRELTERRHLA